MYAEYVSVRGTVGYRIYKSVNLSNEQQETINIFLYRSSSTRRETVFGIQATLRTIDFVKNPRRTCYVESKIILNITL